jgi:hypothetical protein
MHRSTDDYELLCRLDETVENRKGASAATIDAMPTQTVPQGGLPGVAAGERLSCAVCLEEFVEGSELRCLPCLHKFHKVSWAWLRTKRSSSRSYLHRQIGLQTLSIMLGLAQ